MLPNLPKQIKKKEADFTTKTFRKWLLSQSNFYTSAFEIKQTETDSLPFSAVKDHQIAALLSVRKNGLLYKISDESRGAKPFDMFFMKNDEAYVVIKYPKVFVLIDIEAFVEKKKKEKKKSLSTSEALKIATIAVKIGK